MSCGVKNEKIKNKRKGVQRTSHVMGIKSLFAIWGLFTQNRLPKTDAAFPLCNATSILCFRYTVERGSPVKVATRLPKYASNTDRVRVTAKVRVRIRYDS